MRYRGWSWCVRMRAWIVERRAGTHICCSAHTSCGPPVQVRFCPKAKPESFFRPCPGHLPSSASKSNTRAGSQGLGWSNAALWFARDKRSGATRVGGCQNECVAQWHDSVRDHCLSPQYLTAQQMYILARPEHISQASTHPVEQQYSLPSSNHPSTSTSTSIPKVYCTACPLLELFLYSCLIHVLISPLS